MTVDWARIRALRAELTRRERSAAGYSPQKPTEKQAEFLALDHFEALYGGAAGGGKSSALLMAALQYVHVPGYAALILRRQFTDLKQPGALMDRAESWLRDTDAIKREGGVRWDFPGGGSLVFGHALNLSEIKEQFSSAEFQFIGIDELTQGWSEEEYRFLLSRIRRPSGRARLASVPLRMRAATNPGGSGSAWVKRRFVEPGSTDRPFVAARLEHNPHIDAESYRRALAELDETTRAQLERGEWVDDSSARIYKFSERHVITEPPDWGEGGWRYVLGIDLGASEANPSTAFVVCGWHAQVPHAAWVLESRIYAGGEPDDIARRIMATRERYGAFDAIVMDEGALGKAIGNAVRRRFGIGVEPADKAGKDAQRRLLVGAVERGEVMLLMPQCEGLFEESRHVTWDRDGLDAIPGVAKHYTDALRYAWHKVRSFAARAPESKPEPHSREWIEAERLRNLEAERAKVLARKERPFWASGSGNSGGRPTRGRFSAR